MKEVSITLLSKFPIFRLMILHIPTRKNIFTDQISECGKVIIKENISGVRAPRDYFCAKTGPDFIQPI